MAKQPKDKDGFLILIPKPGGTFDLWMQRMSGLGKKIPKDPEKLLDIFADAYGVDQIADMTEVNIGDYVYEKGINHALNLNVGRNIPWIEDGLKRVERRILYAMYQTKMYNGRYSKVATVSGNTIAKFHPHGDMSLNDTIYRLGRKWSMMIPYISAVGNFGNMDEMRPAAPRYASASLSPYAMDCFFSEMGVKYPIFDVIDSYNFSGKEPVYLTSKYPNILMQWNQGISKGASTWLGAFNSKDIFAAALKMIDDPDAKIDIYPDTPAPIDIVNKRELRHCFDMKKFKVVMRAPFKVVADKKRDERGRVVDKFTIVFTALPVNVIGNSVKEEIIAIKMDDEKRSNADKRLPEVLNVEVDANNTTPGGIEIVIEYEKGYDPYALAEKLYKSTRLSTVIGVQYVLISGNTPVYKTPREIMQIWISQRYDQKRRYYHQLLLKSAKDRAILEASCILLESKNIDLAIKLIKESKNDEESVSKLMKAFKFTEFQATMVLKLELRTLNRLNIDDVIRQRDQALADYKHYRKILTDNDAIREIIKEELVTGSKKYGKDRIARLTNLDDKGSGGDPDELKLIYWNKDNYVSASDKESFGEAAGRIDKSYQLLQITNGDKVLVYGRNGYVKLLDGYSFSGNSTGIAFAQIAFPEVAGIVPLRKEYKYLLMLTADGYGKVMTIEDSLNALKSKQISLNTGDSVVGVVPLCDHGNQMVCMIQGTTMYYVRASDFPLLKRTAAGNRILKVDKPVDRVLVPTQADLQNYDTLLVYGEFGYGKALRAEHLKFGKRKPSSIEMNKDVYGAIQIPMPHQVTIRPNEPAEYHASGFTLHDTNGQLRFTMYPVSDKTIRLEGPDEVTREFRIGTSISTPVKIFKERRNEFYTITSP